MDKRAIALLREPIDDCFSSGPIKANLCRLRSCTFDTVLRNCRLRIQLCGFAVDSKDTFLTTIGDQLEWTRSFLFCFLWFWFWHVYPSYWHWLTNRNRNIRVESESDMDRWTFLRVDLKLPIHCGSHSKGHSANTWSVWVSAMGEQCHYWVQLHRSGSTKYPWNVRNSCTQHHSRLLHSTVSRKWTIPCCVKHLSALVWVRWNIRHQCHYSAYWPLLRRRVQIVWIHNPKTLYPVWIWESWSYALPGQRHLCCFIRWWQHGKRNLWCIC